jgi:hypothetical protein
VLAGFNLFLYGCKNWEYDVVKHGIHFKKISKSKSGNYIGYMTDDRIIHGLPCSKGWIHFRNTWKLLSFQLSTDYEYKTTFLPAHTWIHFANSEGRSGYICAFPYNYEVQGYLCGGSGGYKGTHTGFYANGKLRSFFPPEDTVINDILCKASSFTSVELYENGNLKSCKLSKDYQADGKKYKKGRVVEIDKSGKIIKTQNE